MKNELLVYTCCDSKYYMFIPLFCLSHLIYNENADIEIGVCATKLSDNTEKALNIIREAYPNNKIIIDYSAFKNKVFCGRKIINNTARFLIEPQIKNEYTYITDIDIICCEAIMPMHIQDMIVNHSDYSNMVRKNTNRMTGLHFTKTSVYYPLPDISDINIGNNDEMVLYDIVSRRNNIDLLRNFRPVHGIHMSLNRPTVEGNSRIPGWGAEKWVGGMEKIMQNEVFNRINNYLDDKMLDMIIKLKDFYANQNR